tara:strand:+ start:3019 stop:4167 length:1149 start_codon:yes stop_codon:yes gene_type:complete
MPSFFDSNIEGFSGYGWGYLYFSSEDVFWGQVYAFLVLALCLFFRLSLGGILKNNDVFLLVSPDWKDKTKYIFWFLLALYLFVTLKSYFDLTAYGGGVGWGARRESVGKVEQGLSNFLMGVLSFSSYYFFAKKKYYLSLFIFVIYSGSFFILGGTRIPLLAVVLPFIMVWIFKSNGILKALLFASFYSAASFIMDIMRLMRFKNSLAERWDVIVNYQDYIGLLGGDERTEASLRYVYYAFIHGINHYEEFQKLKYFARSLMMFFPASIFDFKPDNFEYDMHEAVSGIHATMHPTFFGTLFADSGAWFFLWIVYIYLFIYIVPHFLYKYSGRFYLGAFGMISLSSMMIARGAFYSSIIYIVYILILFCIGYMTFYLHKRSRGL